MKNDFLEKPIVAAPVILCGVGQGGVSIVKACFEKLDRTKHSHLLGLVANTDHGQLIKHFHKKNVPEDSHLSQWLARIPWSDDPALGVLPLGESGLGAGMDPEVGKAIAIKHEDEIRAFFEPPGKPKPSAVFFVIGLGGGTGSGAGPVFVRIAKELNITRLAIVTMPLSMEGDKKLKKAEAAREELIQECNCPVITILNQQIFGLMKNPPAGGKKMEVKHLWDLINESSPLPLLEFLYKTVHRHASTMNFDLMDLARLLESPYIYQGSFTEDLEKSLEIEKIVEILMNNPFQSPMIAKQATRWLVATEGPWSINELQAVTDDIRADKSGIEIKLDIDNETSERRVIQVLAGSDTDPDTNKPVVRAGSENRNWLAAEDAPKFARTPLGSSNGHSNGKTKGADLAPLVTVPFRIKGKEKLLPVTQDVSEAWSKVIMMNSILTGDNRKTSTEVLRKIKELTGEDVDLPGHLIPIRMW